MPPPDTNPTILEAIKALLASDEGFRKAIIEAAGRAVTETGKVVSNKGSSMSYFRESFGLEMKAVLDSMFADPEKRNWIFRYSHYPELRNSSLYIRINQSLAYLLQHLDLDGKYTKLRDEFVIDRVSNKNGILLVRTCNLSLVKAEPCVDNEKNYSEDIDKFLEDETKPILHLKGLDLSAGMIKNIEDSLIDITNVHALITETEIKIVKIDFMEKGNK